jgi:hypothetical protein
MIFDAIVVLTNLIIRVHSHSKRLLLQGAIHA